jgi:hypothetical protein
MILSLKIIIKNYFREVLMYLQTLTFTLHLHTFIRYYDPSLILVDMTICLSVFSLLDYCLIRLSSLIMAVPDYLSDNSFLSNCMSVARNSCFFVESKVLSV